MDSLKATDAASDAVATHPRVSLEDIKASVVQEHFFTAGQACSALGQPSSRPLDMLTICLLVVKNGFTVVGKSAPASSENFNTDLGRKFAYEDAIRQLWPLMGYSLRDQLYSKNG